MPKTYPYSDDFDELATFNLDMRSDMKLRMTNLVTAAQYRLKAPEPSIKRTRHTFPGHGGKRLTVEVLRPRSVSGRMPWIYYAHGGGFLMDLLPAHLDMCSDYARLAECAVVVPHYRVAIDAPFPIPTEDCYQGLTWAIEQADTLGLDRDRLILAGESAGGALTASLTQMVRDRTLISPIFQMLIYPVTSHRLDAPSMREMPDAPVWGAENAELSWKKYLQGHDTPPLYASPLHTEDLSGLPPAYIEPAEFDVLRDEGVQYAERLRAAGADVELNVTQGTIHAFDLNRDSLITQQAIARRIRALRAAFGRERERITLILEIAIDEGAAHTVVSFLEATANKALAEAGTLQYQWALDQDGRKATVLEQYADAAALVAHMQRTDTAAVAEVAQFTRASVCGVLPDRLQEQLRQRLQAAFFGPLGSRRDGDHSWRV